MIARGNSMGSKVIAESSWKDRLLRTGELATALKKSPLARNAAQAEATMEEKEAMALALEARDTPYAAALKSANIL